MKINSDALKILERKLTDYSKANGSIAEHDSANTNCSRGCKGNCNVSCFAMCKWACGGKLARS
ncbi:MAG: hypothetical protein IJ774_01785 [Selenomonadaceae bacterium]|nr:hypothetical protein [Selenomonadaceae bacterium]